MGRFIVIALGVLATVGLIVAGLETWHRADTIVRWLGWEKRHMALGAVKSTAVGAVAMAQALLFALVVDRLYRRDLVCDLLKLSAVLVFAVCAVSAAAMTVAGR
jgi:hypothetical protein